MPSLLRAKYAKINIKNTNTIFASIEIKGENKK
jgi:hypothetical protein